MPYNPFLSVANSLLPEPHSSLLNGMLFGVKTNLPKGFYEALIATGLVHVVALSGMNISILTALVAQTTSFLGRKASSIFTISLIVLFVWFVGASPTIVRAAIMSFFSVIAALFGKRYWGLLSLCFAAIIMLLWDVSLIANISFQLSFFATLGVIISSRQISPKKEDHWWRIWVRPVVENFRLTIGAQLFTIPILLFHFRQFSLVAPVSNLATGWVIQPIMVVGFVTVIAGWMWLPLGIVPSWFAWVLLTYFIKVAEWCAKVPFASVQF